MLILIIWLITILVVLCETCIINDFEFKLND